MVQKLWHNHFFGLLFCLIGFFMVLPFFQGHILAEEMIFLALTIVVLFTLRTLYAETRHIIVIASLGGCVFLLNLLGYCTSDARFDCVSLFMYMLFFGYAAILIFGIIFSNRGVTLNIIAGAICLYLFIGLAWGLLFGVMDFLLPHAFHLPTAPAAKSLLDNILLNFIYYSFTTLTTIGFGDIVPLAAPARYFSFIEAVIGQMYIGVLVARLVGIHIANGNHGHNIS